MINPMSRTDGGPAFATDPDPKAWEGMSLRDWFAGMAIQSMVKWEEDAPTYTTPEPSYRGIAERAYYLADAMLKARRSGNGPGDKV